MWPKYISHTLAIFCGYFCDLNVFTKCLPWKKGRPWVPEHGGPQQSWRCLPPMPDSNFSNLEVVESPLIFGFSRIFTRAAERTPRPHPVTSFVLSAVLLISFRLIQFSGTLAFYHKTIFMVRCFFCRRPHLMLIEGRLTTSVRHKFWFSKNFKYTYGHKYRPTSTAQWQVNKVSENNSCQQQ